MKRCIARQFWIVRLMVFALFTLCFVPPHARAQEAGSYVVLLPSVGLAPGQRLRLTLFNPDGEPVRAQARSHHSGTIQVGMGDGSVRFIRPESFESFDLDRSDIPAAGEEGTGRLQLRASVYIRMAQPWKKIDGFKVSMETIEISDGTSNTVFFAEVVHPQPATQAFFVGGVLTGFVPGQSLRVTLFNPPFFGSESVPETQNQRVNGHVKIFDGTGDLLAQSDEAVIRPGESRSFDFNRSALAVPGEPGTNRQQVRIKPFFQFRSGRLSPVLASFELVDNSTGKTQVLQGQECLVFFLGGSPDN